MSGPLGRETFTFKSSTLSFTIQNQTFCLVNEFNDKITPSNYYFDVNTFLIPTLNTDKLINCLKTGLYWYGPKIAKWPQNSAGEYFRTKQMDFATSLLALAQIVLHLYIKINFFFFFFLTFFSKNQ